MADESAPPPVGGDVEPAKTKLRLKVSRVEEDKPRTRRRVVTAVPAVPGGVEKAPPTEGKRLHAGQITGEMGKWLWQSVQDWDRKVWITMGTALGLLILFGAWSEWRKTEVRVRLDLREVRLGDKPEVLLLYDFSERLAGLRRDYGRRLAPIRPQIRDLERTMILTKADAAGTAEKTRMVEQVLHEETSKAKTVYEDYRTSVSKIWLEEAGMLDQEFDDNRRKFLEEVEVRAREVGLFYHPEEDADLQQPEIAANEYRLALYRAPPSIKMPDQFGWIEKKLTDWHVFEKDWNARYKGLGARAKQLRGPANTSLDERKERVGIQAQELEKFKSDAAEIQKEMEDYQKRLKVLQEKEALAKGPFEEDVAGIPDAFLCARFPLDGDVARIEVSGKVAEAAPGTLRIVVRGKLDGKTAWAILPFEPTAHKKLDLVIPDAKFRLISDWLED